MSKTGYVYNIIDYTTLLAYFKINLKINIILNDCPWTSRILL